MDEQPNIAEGDIVLLFEKTPRNLGEVNELYPSDGSCVYSCKITRRSAELVQLVTKIVLLEGSDCWVSIK